MSQVVASFPETLIRDLERVVGAGYISNLPELEIDGLRPLLLVRPATGEEIAGCLAISKEAGAAVVPAGNMTWLDGGNTLAKADIVVSLERMNKVIDYSPPDLTAILQGGASIRELNIRAAAENQWLPLDPPGYESASIGGVVACASSGPLRFGFGIPRDYVLGLKLAHADGKMSKCGGKVVKNVAGYDLNKLYTGSFGTLAIVAEATVKLRPAPERITSVAAGYDGHEGAFEFLSRVLKSRLRPASLIVLNPRLGVAAGLVRRHSCVVRFAGSELEVKHQVGALKRISSSDADLAVLTDREAEGIWRSVANVDCNGKFAMSMSVLPSRVAGLYASCLKTPDANVAADAGTGSVRIAFDSGEKVDDDSIQTLKALRSFTETLGGTAFVERAPLEVRKAIDVWSDAGAALALMKAIKHQFDPESILNPGKFVGRI